MSLMNSNFVYHFIQYNLGFSDQFLNVFMPRNSREKQVASLWTYKQKKREFTRRKNPKHCDAF